MNRDDQLTILLTLKDRVPFTFRWMAYANSIRFPFKVCIADGGADDSVQAVLGDRARYPEVDYQYLRYPPDRSYADFYAKVVDALSRIRTPFVAVADNDDFLVVGALRKAVAFLTDHPDHAACGGQCAIFWVTPSAPADEPLYGRDVVWKPHADAMSVDGETARERVWQFSRWDTSTNPHYYNVQRTEGVAGRFHAVRDANFADLFLHEQLLAFLTAIAGKMRQLPMLYVAKQWNSPGSSAGTHHETFGDWLDRMLIPSWSPDFTTLLDVASVALAERDRIGPDEARRCLIEAYRMEAAPALLEAIIGEPTVRFSTPAILRLSRRLLGLTPESGLKRFARALYRRLRWISVDAIHGTQILGRRIANADEDIQPIHRFLTRADDAGAGDRP